MNNTIAARNIVTRIIKKFWNALRCWSVKKLFRNRLKLKFCNLDQKFREVSGFSVFFALARYQNILLQKFINSVALFDFINVLFESIKFVMIIWFLYLWAVSKCYALCIIFCISWFFDFLSKKSDIFRLISFFEIFHVKQQWLIEKQSE